MTNLPKYLAETPEYIWNARSQLFDARLFFTNEKGERVYTESFSMTPRVFSQIINEMITAQQDYFQQREAPSNVVKFSRD